MIRLSRTAGIPARYANRHGLITGPTGTGKTVTLQRLAEEFSRQGVPVFVADVKGDIAALARSCPVELVDLFGEQGRHIRVTPGEMGADLLARSLELTDAQAGALEIAFAVARAKGKALRDLADLRAALALTLREREAVGARFGQVTAASVGVIGRALLRLETEGAARAFGAPGFDAADLLEPGKVTILAADSLLRSPRLYGAFLLALLDQLYRRLPEVGDLERPRLVLFFDEAHLMFDDAPAALLRRIEQTARLIRSKGVGVYFASQSPDDIPRDIRDQLAHRIEHDRALPVGTARFATMGPDGRPLGPATVRVERPDCPLGALSEAERAPHGPASEPAAPAEPAQGASVAEIAVLAAFCLVALGALAWGAWWVYVSGHWQAVLGAAVGVAWFVRRKV